MKRNADPETSELLDYLISQEQEHIRLLNDRLKAVKLMRKYAGTQPLRLI